MEPVLSRRARSPSPAPSTGVMRHSARAPGQPMANEELRHLFERDQEGRRGGLSPWRVARLLWGDWRRRRRLRQLIASGALRTGEDCYHAAMLLQHSPHLADYWRAHLLAQRAVQLGYPPARWLVAAALDRWLMRQGGPQKYGTQYVPAGAPRWVWWVWWGRRYRLWDVDPATTDEERAAWGVPPLEVARTQAQAITRPSPPTRLGRTIATIQAGNLRVEVQDIAYLWSMAPASARGEPQPEPL